jgi:2-polyprenyl-3-methyl-5-hydroxy-6-metoxy-1,4-benzoquinol methylase
MVAPKQANLIRGRTKAWFDQEYENTKDDPWGLSWRPSQSFRYKKMIEALISAGIRNERELTILDIGCATGEFTDSLRRSFVESSVIGVDFAEAAIERAMAKFPATRFEVMGLDCIDQEYPDLANAVTLLEVLYYIPEANRPDVIERVRRCLRPGGVLLVSSMVASSGYCSLQHLVSLLEEKFEIVQVGHIYVRAISALEKQVLRYKRMKGKLGLSSSTSVEWILHRIISMDRMAFFETASRRLFGRRGASHVYVIARRSAEE